MTQVQRFLGFVAATAALGLTLAVLGPRLLGSAGGPGAEIVTQLKVLERRGFSHPFDGGAMLHATSMQFERMSVQVDEVGTGARVSATLDFTGNLERLGEPFRTQVSSLGLEQLTLRLIDGDWVSAEGEAPRLFGLLAALEARRRLLEKGDAGAMRRVYRADAWYIRSERDEVLVSEDWRVIDERGERAIDQRGTTRLTVVVADGGYEILP